MHPIEDEIEAWVKERDLTKAKGRIDHFLREKCSDQDERILLACDWYRRLGLHSEALRVLRLSEGTRGWGTQEFRRRRLYWMARSFNLLGASDFALGLLNHLKPSTYDEYKLMGGMALTRFEFGEAVSAYQKMFKLDPHPDSYASQVTLINYADSLYGTGKYQEALNCVRKIEKNSGNPMLKGIALSAEGEYLANAGEYKAAIVSLEKALSYLPKSDVSSDMGYLRKWYGFALIKSGKRAEGLFSLDLAFTVLYAAGHRPEGWLDVLVLKARAGVATNSEIDLLLNYPGLSEGFQKRILSTVKSSFDERIRPFLGRGPSIDFASNEYLVGGKRTLGLTSEQRLLGWIIRTSPRGLPSVLAKCLLWPNEVFSYLQLEGRLEVALYRMRKHFKIGVTIKNERIHASGKTLTAFSVISEVPGQTVRPTFLQTRAQFVRSDIEAYYEMTRSSACRCISEWKRCGWIISSRTKGNRVEYRVPKM